MAHLRFVPYLCGLAAFGVSLLIGPTNAAGGGRTDMDIYGFVMLDMGYQAGQSDPDYYDVLRPTRLPAYENEFGVDGRFFSGVRQSRMGFKTFTPTELGDLKTIFEFGLYGSGADAGQTTFRLRHAYGELGRFGAGQTWSPFTDIGIYPNSLESWGPNGMALFRNVQLRWMPIQGETRMTIALERPGASADQGIYSDRIELAGIRPRFPLPDISAEYHRATDFGYVELAGIVRRIQWDDTLDDAFDFSGDATGWGLNLSSVVSLGAASTLRMAIVHGEGVENNINDAPVDVGIRDNPGDPTRPIEGVALPLTGFMAFVDHDWSAAYSTAVGYSYLNIDNSDGQAGAAFHVGHYALVNLLYTPVPNVMFGIEGQYGKRENYGAGYTSDDVRLQFSARYNFSSRIGSQPRSSSIRTPGDRCETAISMPDRRMAGPRLNGSIR